MFRIMFAPKATPGKGEIEVLNAIHCRFNSFKIDLENKELVVALYPNYENRVQTFGEMEKLVSEWWDVSKLDYRFEGKNSPFVHIKIPEGYSVITVLK